MRQFRVSIGVEMSCRDFAQLIDECVRFLACFLEVVQYKHFPNGR